MSLSTLFLGLAACHGAHAWGNLGHETIGFIAQNFVNSHTEEWAKSILGISNSSYLGSVATWADVYKYTDEGEFSKPLHFIDAEDNPPTSCNVDFDRDCGDEGCVVSAIANYTQRVQDSSLIAEEVSDALKFIVHFLGDITQPLHDEAFEVGGNEVNVTFNGDDELNLHSIWDTEMPEELVGGYALSDAQTWAANLTAEISNGTYAAAAASWLSGLDISDAKGSALTWATDANKYVCSVVMPDGVEPLESGDLYPKYYDSTIGTIELQIAKAGYRLAAWLDAIAAKQSVAKRTPEVSHIGVKLNVDTIMEELLPASKAVKSKARLRREAVGWGCNHKH